MRKINFPKNHNGKLFLEFFSSIMPADNEVNKVGDCVEICLANQPLGIAEIVSVKKFNFKNLSDLHAFAELGRPLPVLAATLKKQVPDIANDTELDHVVFQYTNRHLENQGTLIMDWWTNIYSLHCHLSPNKIEADAAKA